MPIVLDFNNLDVVEFGFGMETENRGFVQVPVGEDVQSSLVEMVKQTKDEMEKIGDAPSNYEPSEKYSTIEFLTLPLDDGLVENLKRFHDAVNIEEDAGAFDHMEDCFAYYTKVSDINGNRVTAVRRSTQFKTLIKKRNKLVRNVDNTLQVLGDSVFKLDNDFDFLIQNGSIYILRPSGLEFTAQLQEAVMAAVPDNIEVLAAEIDFVNFESISTYAQRHPRAARYIASIKSQSEAHNVNQDKLSDYCRRTNVNINQVDGIMHIDDSQVMGFLEVLDRRRYEIDLADDGEAEIYRAPSRNRVSD
ncbi:Kiwa anti-phage protein KwaB-like domain-containing protein [Halomonas sp. Mc5H-6]|uniref:Kiwa anti-phage protein KwaB-like domain-containing protein n=1 Tax=Halomonas sp. Mc5H-6 TaxID=2954500 RepID=UPI00209748CE|nr:Kiwa anti-phage protein KwaB-like domain-containing protein [Halomonas sp. Mc5H-6]MCO7245838.1 DUF4868 domain-containing protein [Halomonas sp. Mc5H-6]